MLEKFAGWVKAEAALKQVYFNFHHVPDLILRKQVTKTDYAQIKRLLLKVKAAFLQDKAKLQPDSSNANRAEELNVTDEDLVKLELFDVVLSQMRHKFEEQNRVWLDLLKEAKEEISKKQKSMGSSNDKQKRTIQESVLISHLN